MEYEEAINNQYGKSNLGAQILATLKSKGFDTPKKIQNVLAPIEEFHLRGKIATMELAQEVGLKKNTKLLDVGCGFGGSARTLVSNFGCNVTGIDLCEEFCRAAVLINSRLDYDDSIEIRQGNALDMPFNNSSFDSIFIQHVSMNIQNKERLISEIYRLLRPKGRLAINTICAGSINPIHFPVFWANNPSISFLIFPDDLRQIIGDTGFTELSWKNNTKKVIEGIENRRSKTPSNKPRPISNDLIHTNSLEKWKNGIRNLKEGRMVVFQGVFERD
ncbi:MAG: class I SAM-dependent methyltransferase [Promethearchaeota archaeon]